MTSLNKSFFLPTKKTHRIGFIVLFSGLFLSIFLSPLLSHADQLGKLIQSETTQEVLRLVEELEASELKRPLSDAASPELKQIQSADLDEKAGIPSGRDPQTIEADLKNAFFLYHEAVAQNSGKKETAKIESIEFHFILFSRVFNLTNPYIIPVASVEGSRLALIQLEQRETWATLAGWRFLYEKDKTKRAKNLKQAVQIIAKIVQTSENELERFVSKLEANTDYQDERIQPHLEIIYRLFTLYTQLNNYMTTWNGSDQSASVLPSDILAHFQDYVSSCLQFHSAGIDPNKTTQIPKPSSKNIEELKQDEFIKLLYQSFRWNKRLAAQAIRNTIRCSDRMQRLTLQKKDERREAVMQLFYNQSRTIIHSLKDLSETLKQGQVDASVELLELHLKSIQTLLDTLELLSLGRFAEDLKSILKFMSQHLLSEPNFLTIQGLSETDIPLRLNHFKKIREILRALPRRELTIPFTPKAYKSRFNFPPSVSSSSSGSSSQSSPPSSSQSVEAEEESPPVTLRIVLPAPADDILPSEIVPSSGTMLPVDVPPMNYLRVPLQKASMRYDL